jgi:NAD(P)-dependent dehydrogenase (short-subunit alcohol dehydrogenase family)
MRLDGRVAVITGSASGFGQAAAVRFAQEGARIVIVDLHEKGATATAKLVADVGGQSEVVLGDVSRADVAATAVDRAVKAFGGIDVVVNNAGIVRGSVTDTWDCPEDDWDRVIAVNLKSVYLLTRASIPVLIERGGGSIVNTSSIAASSAVGGAAYAASKGGMISFTRNVSADLAPKGIRVNCVSPGFMRSPMTSGEREGLPAEEQQDRLRRFGERVPMNRVGVELDIANAMLYLASDESAYVTGQEIVVDGGYLVR